MRVLTEDRSNVWSWPKAKSGLSLRSSAYRGKPEVGEQSSEWRLLTPNGHRVGVTKPDDLALVTGKTRNNCVVYFSTGTSFLGLVLVCKRRSRPVDAETGGDGTTVSNNVFQHFLQCFRNNAHILVVICVRTPCLLSYNRSSRRVTSGCSKGRKTSFPGKQGSTP